MRGNSAFFSSLAKVANSLGKGLIAGFAGTVAITISQMIEMQITKRSMSDAPVKVGGDVLGVEPKGKAELEKKKQASDQNKSPKKVKETVEANKEKFSQLMHFGYGTGWGVARSTLDLMGVQGLTASMIHFGGIWGTAAVMLPAKNAAPPITEWPAKEIAIDALHHAVYAFATGIVYDAMKKK
ncbi:MAG: hypothetical protein ACNS60_04905 [Candidatus Cyclobacteriaceae bacterium M2_1C_046]